MATTIHIPKATAFKGPENSRAVVDFAERELSAPLRSNAVGLIHRSTVGLGGIPNYSAYYARKLRRYRGVLALRCSTYPKYACAARAPCAPLSLVIFAFATACNPGHPLITAQESHKTTTRPESNTFNKGR